MMKGKFFVVKCTSDKLKLFSVKFHRVHSQQLCDIVQVYILINWCIKDLNDVEENETH